ncbi:MAG: hypothetical protein KGH60_02065 [Candidatus Micrarchaeota archaeon]|nr:hypothetical protein [Candidatus Micrarchaeota archaeon]
MRISVAVVEPMYQINLGHIARTMKNFGSTQLFLINPRCRHTGSDAIKYSKHARDVLESAKALKSLGRLPKTDLLIGTTGVWHKSEASYYNIFPLNEIGKVTRNRKNASVTILLGRDGTGLTKDELRECDASVFIATDKEYPVMNISHALAVILYELTRGQMDQKNVGKFSASDLQIKGAVSLFRKLASSNKGIRDKDGVVKAFAHILNRAAPTSKELNAISIALSTRIKKPKK